MNQAMKTAEFLKQQVDEKGMIDVGAGVERELGVKKEKLKEALYILEREGYEVYGGGVPQVTNKGKQTNLKVLCPPGTEHKDIYNFDEVHSVRDYVSHDDGETFDPKWVYPESMSSKRLAIRYAEDGGIDKDGVIEIRRGVEDLSLGESHYAQVRILVDGNRYLKGMAVYSDDMPEGVDVIFNTNKKKGTPTADVLKKIKNDPTNPFGSLIKEGIVDPDDGDNAKGGQSYYYDKDGNKKLSLINKRAEEGDWSEWSNKLPSQFLSKQSLSLVNKQLDLATADKMSEYDEICSLTNPTVKKALLKSFADDCDSAAEHLQAAALPRQKYQVILPIASLKDNEVYAPNFKDGETVALIRYPHGGTFEIPILTVNNKQKEARNVLGSNPKDAISSLVLDGNGTPLTYWPYYWFRPTADTTISSRGFSVTSGCDCSAVAKEGIAYAYATTPTLQERDAIFEAEPSPGYTFAGWYSDEACTKLVSAENPAKVTTPKYTGDTAAATSLALYAKATKVSDETGIYLKQNGVYKQVNSIWKKTNGIWAKTDKTVFDTGKKYILS